MKTYAEKLKDPRWEEFRQEVIRARGRFCECCESGDSSGGRIHVHHTQYITGRDPWDYNQEDMRVLCESCHTQIHDCENAFRNAIRKMDPNVAFEWQAVCDLFEGLDYHSLRTLAARTRNVAYGIKHEQSVLEIDEEISNGRDF